MTPYAEVIGDPVAHSKSPLIHRFWLKTLGIEGDYCAVQVRPDELGDYFAARRSDPAWRGCNVTMPHKQAVQPFLDTVSREASRVGAVNTVHVSQDRLVGENTDVDGILAALPPDLLRAGDEVCVLGTGGAARAALTACRRRDVGTVRIAARDQPAGRALLDALGWDGTVSAIDDQHPPVDVFINATSLGMTGKAPMPDALLAQIAAARPDTVVLDMVYQPLDTALLRAARAAELRTVDGLAMLVGQAAEAFRLFFGAEPPRGRDNELRALLTS